MLPAFNLAHKVINMNRWMRCWTLIGVCCQATLLLAEEQLPLVRALGNQVQAELKLTPSAHFTVSGVQLESVQAGADYFYVTVVSDEISSPPAMLGSYAVEAQQRRLAFNPRYPLSPFVTYEVHLGPKLQQQLKPTDSERLLFRLPQEPPKPKTTVSAVYPTANQLPENLLKFYIHFSAPMQRGEAYQRIHLFQGDQLVEEPFLELGEELWDTRQTRFTLFIHPGRIKRGVRPREEQGPAITAGKEYVLRVDADWLDANRNPLATAFEKKFTVTAPDREQLDPQNWKIETPAAQSHQPVGLVFDEPLDHGMLSRVLTVKHNSGTTIEGVAEVVDGEAMWRFTPTEAWAVGTYNIEVDTNLEDLCGNSIARPFEVQMPLQPALKAAPRIAIEFIVQ
jgi:hypothetical protein